jgi:predicted phosphoribosyltransferase
VPVAAEVAAALGAPLDVILVRKLGVPSQPELAMGAIGEGGVHVLDQRVLDVARVRPAQLEAVEARERVELERRARRYRGGRARLDLSGCTALVVDDGVATGSTARAACQVARAAGASRVVLAAPVGPTDLATRLEGAADEVILCEAPLDYRGVGQAYASFPQVADEEVVDALAAGVRSEAGDG